MIPDASRSSGQRAFAWVGVAVAAALGLCCAALAATYLLPRGHEDVWQWPWRKEVAPLVPWTAPAAVALALVSLLTLDGIRAGKAPSRLVCGVLVACLTIASGGLMVAMAVDDPDYPFRAPAAILGDMSMGYYAQAVRARDAGDFVRSVQERTNPLVVPERVATHPPGPVLYFRAARNALLARPALTARLQRILEAWSGDRDLRGTALLSRQVSTLGPGPQDVVLAFWPGLALTLLAPLAVPFVFGIGAVAAGRRAGLCAATLACAVPSLVCFNPSVDGLTAVVAGAVVLTWLWTLRGGGMLPACVCGVLWALGLMWTFGVAALAVPVGVVGLAAWRGGTRIIAPAVGVLVGVLATWGAGLAAFGYNPVTSMFASLAAQRHVLAMWERPYGPSVVWNLYDFALFAGPALVVMAAIGTAWGLLSGRRPHLPAALGLGLALMVLTLTLWGGTRGEVGRIWGLAMPLLAVPGALPLLSLRGWGLMSAGTLLAAAQIVLCIALHTRLLLVAP